MDTGNRTGCLKAAVHSAVSGIALQ